MKIIVLNCGSSSLKFQLIDMDNEEILCKGNFERIGGMKTTLKLNIRGEKSEELRIARDYDEAIEYVLQVLQNPANNLISSVDEIDAIGHRVVHGGEKFDKSVFISDIENFDSEILYMFDVQFKNKPFVFTEEYPVRSVFATCMEDATDEYSSKDVCYRLPVKANIYRMMSALLRYYSGVRDDLDRVVYHNVLRLRDVVYYIAEHYTEKIYIEKLAEMVNVSADYFTKMFRDSIGKTPIEYINGLRVNRAMLLLFNTKSSMADIADEIGFCNSNYFHKIFKQYMNQSPLAYRKATF